MTEVGGRKSDDSMQLGADRQPFWHRAKGIEHRAWGRMISNFKSTGFCILNSVSLLFLRVSDQGGGKSVHHGLKEQTWRRRLKKLE